MVRSCECIRRWRGTVPLRPERRSVPLLQGACHRTRGPSVLLWDYCFLRSNQRTSECGIRLTRSFGLRYRLTLTLTLTQKESSATAAQSVPSPSRLAGAPLGFEFSVWKDKQVTHTHTDREQHPRHRHTHAHDENNTPNNHLPQAPNNARRWDQTNDRQSVKLGDPDHSAAPREERSATAARSVSAYSRPPSLESPAIKPMHLIV